jgi:hypothetical protein
MTHIARLSDFRLLRPCGGCDDAIGPKAAMLLCNHSRGAWATMLGSNQLSCALLVEVLRSWPTAYHPRNDLQTARGEATRIRRSPNVPITLPFPAIHNLLGFTRNRCSGSVGTTAARSLRRAFRSSPTSMGTPMRSAIVALVLSTTNRCFASMYALQTAITSAALLAVQLVGTNPPSACNDGRMPP